jgi:hypothetical protein
MQPTPGDANSDNAERLCPSGRCVDGAILLGVVDADGVVGYITPQLVVDQDFVERAHAGRAPQQRFRFSEPCQQSACLQWAGGRCTLIDRALAVERSPGVDEAQASLPKCSIRARCRWFAQRGREACKICPLVITKPEAGLERASTSAKERAGSWNS